MAEIAGCARVTGSVKGQGLPSTEGGPLDALEQKEKSMTVLVGKKAPEFTAPSYYKGGFSPISLTDFAGKWLMVCFYPGDFTFV
jgi:peroxiredoxin (alkyl hydroperoxide reductase subunit C)